MANEQTQTDAWKAALASRRTQVADSEAVPAAMVSPLDRDVSRRNFIRASFFGGLGLTLLGSVGMLLDYLYPRNVKGFGGPVPAGNVADYVKGADPVPNSEGQFWIANLDPAEDRPGGTGGADGMLALWRKCPHLGCTVPWRATFSFEGDAGWYRCPCHGSTYTKAGVRVFGPAPRSMDTMAVEIDAAGNITVQTGAITPGGPDNPDRAVPV
ncbi:MAG: ubiquinol-cytochrome c reductase iron-sulfur subunit [Dehalococcoidia bacterium]|nr:ubiquinol-cytochrome c reductase iron-sulfur subunit [Dehalococcoidia bacterium]MCA9849460.1 ubiquinol-cytochrome c reductase iron-sulfur subunit [Dehalococcoidia bacterium]MCA9856369.1 ubiquinol-cytochrome c reductase iron-sulfur subunit [Dehalococcoidia bacterium]MCB9483145.1 ubiquinol-cytochrome c reductase iron-sulfur subunit [Dehalococcoidia bacterium]